MRKAEFNNNNNKKKRKKKNQHTCLFHLEERKCDLCQLFDFKYCITVVIFIGNAIQNFVH